MSCIRTLDRTLPRSQSGHRLAGAERLKSWRGRKLDGFALWGLHSSACSELAESAALCVEALQTFGIELSGSAAAKAGNPVAEGVFCSIADYLRAKVCSAVGPFLDLLHLNTCVVHNILMPIWKT